VRHCSRLHHDDISRRDRRASGWLIQASLPGGNCSFYGGNVFADQFSQRPSTRWCLT
jgi:hypothetical protein